MTMQRPQIKNIDAAIRAYYGNGYIGTAEIKEIFNVRSSSTVSKLKKYVRQEEADRGVPIVVPHCINVKVAYEVWGIDIDGLVKNRKRLQALNLV